MNVVDSIIHDLIDVAAGRKNLPVHAADALHESLTPGFTVEEPSDADLKAAQAVLDKAALAKQGAAAKAADDAPVSGFAPAPV